MTNQYLNLLSRLWAHLSLRRRGQFILVFGLSGVSALAEMIGLGIIFPFLAVLISPEKVFAMPIIAKTTKFFGISNTEELLFTLTAALILVSVSATFFKLLFLWASAQVSSKAAGDLNIEVFRRTLFQPYITHTRRNSSEIIAGISAKLTQAMLFLSQTMIVTNSTIAVLAITAILIKIDTLTATISLLSFSALYLLVGVIVNRRLRANGLILSEQVPRTYKTLQESFAGIRDVLLDGSQNFHCQAYSDSEKKIRRIQATNSFVNVFPRHVMEAFGIVCMAIFAYWLAVGNDTSQDALPIVGALALGAQRMLPNLQAIYGAWASIVSSAASVSDTLDLLDQPLPVESAANWKNPLKFKRCIQFKTVNFAYDTEDSLVLRQICITIHKGDRIGIVGTTGGGKSTLLDILMGLLHPTQGALLVDDVPITDSNCIAWRRNIAHVPQVIFLADATVAENIALGIPLKNINMARVREAARQAQVADVIESRHEGYLSRIGERGVKLSGGQRQRLGIARALYKKASVLVLDEATNALDTITEQGVMEAVRDLDPTLTLIIVSHRLSTLKDCNWIIRIENGQVANFGTFQEVLDGEFKDGTQL
jgi:ABC-type bacteriocin/lantibiotic exporter with double-glycine peptidase domain